MPEPQGDATVWLDVEDLFDYFRYNPHPSGIQRVALAIMHALLAAAPERVRLVRHGDAPTRFRTVTPAALEAMLATPPLPLPSDEPEDDQGSRIKRAVRRLPPELRDPLVRAGVLQGAVLRNARALLHLVRPPPPRPLRAVPEGEAGDGPARGDLVVCLGAPWSVRGGPARLAALQAAGVRTALLLHDLIPVRRPDWFPPDRVERFRSWLAASLRHSGHLLTVSRFTADDAAGYAARHGLHLPAPSVLPAGSSALPAVAAETPAGLPVAGSYVLFVSTLEARKNHGLAVRVWQRLLEEVRTGSRAAASVPQLVFAGRVGTGVADLLQQLDNSRWLGGRVRLIREPGDAEVAALYRGCRFTLMPSLFEGWGLPLGESLAFGKPCLAASGTALPEAGGDLCRYFDPEDETDAHRAVAALLDDPAALAAWQADLAARWRPAGWDAAAAAILALAA